MPRPTHFTFGLVHRFSVNTFGSIEMILLEKRSSKWDVERKSFIVLIESFFQIGAGTSLPGLVAAKIAATKVILCDSPKFERWFSFVQQIISLNPMIADRMEIEPLDWNDSKTFEKFIEKYSPDQIDFLLGSDIFFDKKGKKMIMNDKNRFNF